MMNKVNIFIFKNKEEIDEILELHKSISFCKVESNKIDFNTDTSFLYLTLSDIKPEKINGLKIKEFYVCSDVKLDTSERRLLMSNLVK